MLSKIRTISCDQVSWISAALQRYADVWEVACNFPRASHMKDLAKAAFIVEMIDILGIHFEDERARHNMAISLFSRPLAKDLAIAEQADSTQQM